MRKKSDRLVFSPSDLIQFMESPFASWMDRFYLENPDQTHPDEETEDQKLIAETGNQHERAILQEFKEWRPDLVELSNAGFDSAIEKTRVALQSNAPIIYQAALADGEFAGYADFLIRDDDGQFRVWDTKLARKPKPYYAIQLCCYSEMLAAMTEASLPQTFGIILGTSERVEFRVEDFIHLYQGIKEKFLEMQHDFTGDMKDRPEPMPRANHGRWASVAESFFLESDHLVQVAGISVGQIKKLRTAGISTMAELAKALPSAKTELAADTFDKLTHQARLQCQTRGVRRDTPAAPPCFEVLPTSDANGVPLGLAALPKGDQGDVFFDIEGYPLVDGGLEYLWGVCHRVPGNDQLLFKDWWAHDRAEEKLAFEGFVDWCMDRWRAHPRMHICHYAAYEVSAIRRLSTRHDTRQEEVDAMLRAEVFVDLYQIVRRGLRIGEDSYSIKKVEHLYRPGRSTEVATAVDSIVQYARWMESDQDRDWEGSDILRGIRDYNEDDCVSTAELFQWLAETADGNDITRGVKQRNADPSEQKELPPEAVERQEIAAKLRVKGDDASRILADLVDYHRREEKPVWWRMFDRAEATPEELRDDQACVEGVTAVGGPTQVKRSLAHRYTFEPSQECKLSDDGKTYVMFSHNLAMKLNVLRLDLSNGEIVLKASEKALREKSEGEFPAQGSLIKDEYLSAAVIAEALTQVASSHLSNDLPSSAAALLKRRPPADTMRREEESVVDAAVRVAGEMSGSCLLIQGPPGTGKTYTASHVIASLLRSGKRVGVTSNSHRGVINILEACGEAMRKNNDELRGIKVGGENDDAVFENYPKLRHLSNPSDALAKYREGIVGGTAWLFTRSEWQGELDYLVIDEAGQVPLANAIAMARASKNMILLGDQMQLEQPIQGSHPGDAGMSALQFALKDIVASKEDAPVFHAVAPSEIGLFLGESRRMHPDVCRFISESIYEGRLKSHPDCARQRIILDERCRPLVTREAGVLFSGVEHDGNVQQSDEEVARVRALYQKLLGREFVDSSGETRILSLDDFLFIAPYNAQVRSLKESLPEGARVGSVDKFQGQQAPVCILSLCSSFGEYGSRGLGFILDQNRVNVAISRAQCLSIVVADPRIANSPITSLNEMKLLNLFCKLIREGAPGASQQ
jgi:predicted RecB family nuclease